MKLFRFEERNFLGNEFEEQRVVGLIVGREYVLLDRAEVTEVGEIEGLSYAICDSEKIINGRFEYGCVYQVTDIYDDGKMVEVLDEDNSLVFSESNNFVIL